MTIRYFGGEDVASMVDKLERLLKDVTAINHGAAPTEDELAAAPILT